MYILYSYITYTVINIGLLCSSRIIETIIKPDALKMVASKKH